MLVIGCENIKEKLKGQITIETVYRTKCIIDVRKSCNIYNAGKVAINCDIDCKFGCCNSCKEKSICGACCNNARYLATKVK